MLQDFLSAVRAGRQEYLTDYKPEYDRLRRERDEAKTEAARAKAPKSGQGQEVRMGGLCHSMREEVMVPANIHEGTGIFLGRDGDEDEDKEETPDLDREEESREGDGFRRFIDSHKAKTQDKIHQAASAEKS